MLKFWILCVGSLLYTRQETASAQTLTAMPSIVPVNGPVTLTCTLSTFKFPVVWRLNHDDNVLLNTGIYNGKCDSDPTPFPAQYDYSCISSTVYTLTIKQVTSSQDGNIWQCGIPGNGAEETTWSINLTINVQSPVTSVSMTPANNTVDVIVDTRVQLQCLTSAGKPAPSVKWFKIPSTPGAHVDITSSSSGPQSMSGTTSNLTLQVTRSDQGAQIYCTAENGGAAVESTTKPTLNILYGPSQPVCTYQGQSEAGPIRIIEGQTLTISCASDSKPTSTYSWSYPGGSHNGQNLILTNIQRNQKGTFTVQARNAMYPTGNIVGVAKTNFNTIVVDVLYGPDLVAMTPSSTNYTMFEGESLNNITCSATCYPEPCTFTWTKSDVGSSISSTGVLSLRILQRGDAGIYICTARNPESNATATGQIIEVVVIYCTTSATLQSQSQVGSIVGGVVPGILLVGFIAVLIYLRLTNRIHFTKIGIESHAAVNKNASKRKEIPNRVYEELCAASTTETAATDNPANAANYEALAPGQRSTGVYSSLQETTSPDNIFAQSSAIGTNAIELQEQSAYRNIRHT